MGAPGQLLGGPSSVLALHGSAGRITCRGAPRAALHAASGRQRGLNVTCVAISGGVEAIEGVPASVDAAIRATLAAGSCLVDTDLGIGTKRKGKVRDTYDLGERLLIVTSDRQSAFDRVLAAVPYKGQVLNQTSAWWMEQTAHLVPNALLGIPDPSCALMKKCDVFPVEFVVRGYMTGSTSTSIWTRYAAGERTYCGHRLPEGLAKNAALAAPLVTPTTKADDGDVPVSAEEVVGRGLMSAEDWEEASSAALALFVHGQAAAAARGLLLVDTKYEFGKDADGRVLLVDEIHTPDSSRYWLASSYEARHAAGQEPQNVDKEFLRLWFRDNCDPYNDPVLPEAPAELVTELSRRYIYLYQTITGQTFEPASPSEPAAQRIARNVAAAL